MSKNATKGEAEKPEADLSFFAELKRRKVFRVAITYAIVAWLIIQVAAVTFPPLLIPDWALRLVVMSVLLGFPIALILAWAFELTPDGLRTTRSTINNQSNSESRENDRRRKRFSLIGATALPVFIFAGIAVYFIFQTDDTEPLNSDLAGLNEAINIEKSIAILPFENRSNLSEDVFFTDGIHDDLLTQVARIDAIKTISRTSVLTYRNTEKNVRTIAEELGVSTILEGGVQRAGNNIRINVQLIDAVNDSHLWAETYTRELNAENIFSIQSEITQAIAIALKEILTPQEQEDIKTLPTQNLMALEAYFMAKARITEGNSESYIEAVTYLQEAVALDPDFAEAYITLADAYLTQIFYNGFAIETQINLTQPLISKVRELQGESSALTNIEGLLKEYSRSLESAESLYQRAIALNSNNVRAYINYGHLLSWLTGNPSKAVQMFEQAERLSPADNSIKHQLAEALMNQGEWQQAQTILEEIISNNPDYAMAWVNLGILQKRFLGRIDDSIYSFHRAIAADPGNPSISGRMREAYNFLGNSELSTYWLNLEMKQAPNSNNASANEGIAYLAVNDTENALAAFYRASPGSDQFQFVLGNIARIEVERGHASTALEYIGSFYPQLLSSNPNVNFSNTDVALSLSTLLIETGENARGRFLLDKSVEFLQQMHNKGWLSASIELADLTFNLGDEDRAGSIIKQYVAAGGGSNSFVQSEELANSADPEIRALIPFVQARLDRQLQNLRQMELNGDIPTISISD